MVKKSGTAKANKSHKSHKSRSPKEGPAKSSGWGARRNKVGGRRKQIKSSAGNDNAFGNIKKLATGKKSKNGCLPKVFMMLLLFTVVGASFFLSL